MVTEILAFFESAKSGKLADDYRKFPDALCLENYEGKPPHELD